MKKYRVNYHLLTMFTDADVVDLLVENGTISQNEKDTYVPNGHDISDYAFSLYQNGKAVYAGLDVNLIYQVST